MNPVNIGRAMSDFTFLKASQRSDILGDMTCSNTAEFLDSSTNAVSRVNGAESKLIFTSCLRRLGC